MNGSSFYLVGRSSVGNRLVKIEIHFDKSSPFGRVVVTGGAGRRGFGFTGLVWYHVIWDSIGSVRYGLSDIGAMGVGI